jgi:hypothetical protein
MPGRLYEIQTDLSCAHVRRAVGDAPLSWRGLRGVQEAVADRVGLTPLAVEARPSFPAFH